MILTNDDIRYQRNRIRHRIIPELESINPNVVDAIARLGSSVSEDLAVISNLTVQAFERLVTIDKNEMCLSRKALRKGTSCYTTSFVAAFDEFY